MHDLALATPFWLAVLGVAVNALVGALYAYLDDARHWDVVGVVAFAFLMGLGGGLLRDLLLGNLPPLSLRSPWAVITVLVTAALGRVAAPWVRHAGPAMAVLEAVALALFAMTGTAFAAGAGLPWTSAVLVGVVSAVGGGVLVSLVRGEIPSILQPGRPNALLAAWCSGIYLALSHWNAAAASLATVVLAVVVHLLSARGRLATRPLSLDARA